MTEDKAASPDSRQEAFTNPATIGLVPDGPCFWRSPAGVRVGMNDDGTVDEIFSGAGHYVHVEQMDDSYYWAIFGDLHVHFSYAKGRRIVLTLGWLEDEKP